MNTMWVTGPIPRSWSARDAARTWSTISAVVQLRRSPMCPVAQNGTADCAAHLAADADRRPPPGVGSRGRLHRDGLDRLAVARRQSELDRLPAVGEDLGVDGSRRELEFGGERFAGAPREAGGPPRNRRRTAARRRPGSGVRARPVRRGGTAPGPRTPRPRCSRLGWASVHGTDERVCRRQPRRLPCI